ncbi:putative zinc metalloprotease [Verticillium dahliae VDG2]|nr:putative zinc metalloprotease [Verticillium dahliae VDG2]
MECSRIGRDLLRLGGNAIDAMVGTQLCVGVTSMYHSGIGGGGFALVRTADGEYETIDFRETAPAAATQDMYNDDVHASIEGGLAVGVPSELRGLEYMHEKWGDLAWESVVMPASHLAREGFSVTADMVRYMVAGMKDAGRDFLIDEPSWAEVFAPNGTLLGEGDTMYRTRLAE